MSKIHVYIKCCSGPEPGVPPDVELEVSLLVVLVLPAVVSVYSYTGKAMNIVISCYNLILSISCAEVSPHSSGPFQAAHSGQLSECSAPSSAQGPL